MVKGVYRDRGLKYFLQGQVILKSVTPKTVKAQCVGTRVYKVQIKDMGNRLEAECSCPAFEDFGPCKHIAATAYAVMQQHSGGYKASEESLEECERLSKIESYLMVHKKNELVSMILQYMSDDPEELYYLEEEAETYWAAQ